MGGGYAGGRLRFALPVLCAALALPAPVTALASGGQLTAASPLTVDGPLSPGDLVAAGLDLSYAAAHPATTVSVSATASLELSCRTGEPPVAHLYFGLRSASFALPAGDTTWHATASPSAAAGYLGTVRVPDACGGHKLWADGGVGYAGRVVSADTRDQVQLRFHAVDGDGTDCTAQPGSGSSACSADWTAPVSTLPVAPQPSPASRPSSPAPAPRPTGRPATSAGAAVGTGAGGAADAAATTSGAAAALAPGLEAPGASPPASPDAGGGFALPVVGPSERIVGRSQPVATTVIGAGGSILDDLPLGWIGLLGGMDLLLVAAVVVRRRRLARGLT
jgi:hypothetical protein